MPESPYADLNKTQADAAAKSRAEADRQAALEAARRAELSQGHRPNAQAMKAEQARTMPPQPAPQPEPKQAADFLSASPNRTMTPQQIEGYNIAAGVWNEQHVQVYRQNLKDDPGHATRINADQTTKAWDHHIAAEVKRMPPVEIADRLDMLGRGQEAVKFEDDHSKRMRGGLRTEAETLRQQKAEQVIKLEIAARTRTPEQQLTAIIDRQNRAHFPLSPVEVEKQRQAELRRELDGLPKQERQQTPTERERTARLEQSQDAQAQSRDLSQGHRRGI